MRLISELYSQYRGKPALVIGGGPSVRVDLAPDNPKLSAFYPALVLSANEHGHHQKRYPVDYIVHCDKKHCMRHVDMVEYLRQYNTPLISKWGSADVRLEEWRFNGNSGLTAVAVAAALGCSPIVVTGIDFWATGRTYFYDNLADLTPKQRKLASKPVVIQPDRRLRALEQFVEGAHIRPLSGLMTAHWRTYDPAEQFGVPPLIPYAQRTYDIQLYRAVHSFHWSNYDTIPQGTVMPLTKGEAAPLLAKKCVALIVSQA